MLGITQSMVARNQMEFNRKRRSKGSQLFDELAAALRQNHAILLAMKNGRTDWTKPIETCFPIGFALFNPLPCERKIPMRRVVIPGHPSGGVPRMVPLIGNGPRPHSHHIECGSNKNQPLNFLKLLPHEPGDPASE